MPHTLPKAPKDRKYVRLWNNKWQEGRYKEVENLGYVEACEERGIKVENIEVNFCLMLSIFLTLILLCTFLRFNLMISDSPYFRMFLALIYQNRQKLTLILAETQISNPIPVKKSIRIITLNQHILF